MDSVPFHDDAKSSKSKPRWLQTVPNEHCSRLQNLVSESMGIISSRYHGLCSLQLFLERRSRYKKPPSVSTFHAIPWSDSNSCRQRCRNSSNMKYRISTIRSLGCHTSAGIEAWTQQALAHCQFTSSQLIYHKTPDPNVRCPTAAPYSGTLATLFCPSFKSSLLSTAFEWVFTFAHHTQRNISTESCPLRLFKCNHVFKSLL